MTVILARALAPCLALTLGVSQVHAGTGVVIEGVTPFGAADCGDLRSGDVLLQWQQLPVFHDDEGAVSGSFESPLDVLVLERSRGLAREIEVRGTRDGRPFTVILEPRRWQLAMRPELAEADLSSYRAGRDAVKAGDASKGAEIWSLLARDLSRHRDRESAVWLMLRAAEVLSAARLWEAADDAFGEAIAEAERFASTDVAAVIRASWGLSRWQRNDLEGAVADFMAAFELSQQDGLAGAEALGLAAQAERNMGRFDVAVSRTTLGLELAESTVPGTLLTAWLCSGLGIVDAKQGKFDATEEWYRRALKIRARLAPVSREHAGSLTNMGAIAHMRGRLDEAEGFYERALEITRQVDPDGVDAVNILNNLGLIAGVRGHGEQAWQFFNEAQAIVEARHPGSMLHSRILQNLAIARVDVDPREAEALFQQVLEIRSRLAPDSLAVATVLTNLGSLAVRRGDFLDAERLFREALAIEERVAPEGLAVINTLDSLGSAALRRGDVDAAESIFRRVLALNEKLAPDSLAVADSLDRLASVARGRGDLATTGTLCRRALEIRQEVVPEGLQVAWSQVQLADLAARTGDPLLASQYYESAIERMRLIKPRSQEALEALIGASLVKLTLGELADAERLATEAVATSERIENPTIGQSAAYRALALVEIERGQLQLAAERYRQAVDTLDLVRETAGLADDRSVGFSGRYYDHYTEYIDLLVELGRPDEAFNVLERARARSQLAMLANRDLGLTDDIPPDLEGARRAVDAEFARLQDEVADLSADADEAELQRLIPRLHELRDRRAGIAEDIRLRSPRIAALRNPAPLDLDAVRRLLDPGTVLLSYAAGAESSHLFVLSAVAAAENGFAVFELDAGVDELADDVRRYRELLSIVDVGTRSGVDEASEALYARLVGPAEGRLKDADRIVISPDGPLNLLPFAALVRQRIEGKPQYLMEWKPLHTVSSASVYAELRRPERVRTLDGERQLVAFGDPTYLGLGSPDVGGNDLTGVRSIVLRGRELTRLPASRQEVEELGKLWGETSQVNLGAAATEEAAKAIGRDADVVHFACHGVVDERMPMDSALVLSRPQGDAGENGILQAWEIIEQVRLDADLVVLSACDTGLGREVRGEGLIGLTRAFHFAGARSVVASLWAVPDASTAVLMRRFHEGLKAGLSTDEALRQAQLSLIRGPVEVPDGHDGTTTIDASHPYAWAGFQLYGDWR